MHTFLFFKFSEMLLKLVFIEMFGIKSIIPFMQGDTMVVDNATDIDSAMEML